MWNSADFALPVARKERALRFAVKLSKDLIAMVLM